MGALEDRVVIVTGAGRGLGREHVLLAAAEGARVIVNDLGCAADGSGAIRRSPKRSPKRSSRPEGSQSQAPTTPRRWTERRRC